ncbi:MAG: phosphate acyltransferase, partial [Verrucomicrobiota bacterium]|nr:phosphate acyltransferase [Verrucomicrobiota bacterium]
MRIALDVMGGDHAPHEIVHGAVEASIKLKDIDCVLMVGDETAIRAELAKYPKANLDRLKIIHAPEAIGMDESPATAVRKKKQCSINICMELVKSKEADAMVSAGNSGAVTASAVFCLGRTPGVLRPAIATVLPTRQPQRPLLLLDAGANTDCNETWLAQFAVMGSA